MPNNHQCLQFYYYQQEVTVGNLNVYVKFADDKVSSLLPLWSGKIKGFWQIVQVSLGHALGTGSYQAVFEGFVPKNDLVQPFAMYIDDVLIRDESCLPLGDCDFEHGFCKT